jgi:hypothetical protein
MTISEIRGLIRDWTETNSVGSYTDTKLTRDINLAYDEYWMKVKKAAGTWQADDSNHTKYPNIKFNLTSSQQDYNFTEDEQGNQVQDIYRVEIKLPDGTWTKIDPYDEMGEEDSISQRETTTGVPSRYYKTANGIFLDVTPNYSQTNGIRMWYTRSPDYLLVADTTKEPGMPNSHHVYLAAKVAYRWWLPKDRARASDYKVECKEIEDDIMGDVADRSRDEQKVFVPEQIDSV